MSVFRIISSRYGVTSIKALQKFAKIDYRLGKAEPELGFLIKYSKKK